MDKAVNMLESIDFPQELIINRSREAFLKGLKDSGVFTDVSVVG